VESMLKSLIDEMVIIRSLLYMIELNCVILMMNSLKGKYINNFFTISIHLRSCKILHLKFTCPNKPPQYHRITWSYNLLAALNKELCFCLLYIYLWNTSTWRQHRCKHMDWNFHDQVVIMSQPRLTLRWLNNCRHW